MSDVTRRRGTGDDVHMWLAEDEESWTSQVCNEGGAAQK